MTLPVRRAGIRALVDGILVRGGVDHAPKRGTNGGHHSNNAPICGKILDAPDYGDDDWSEGEGAAIAKADESSGQMEKRRFHQRERRSEKEIPNR